MSDTTLNPHIQVEMAIAWPDHSWDDGHYVYVPENIGDIAEAAKNRMEAKLAANKQEFSFLTVYSWNEDQRFTETGEPFPE